MAIVDRRERALSAALGEYPHVMKDLPIGDVLCSYEDGTQWIAERKTTRDLAQSIRTGHPAPRARTRANNSKRGARARDLCFCITGRWAEQVSRLHQAYTCIFFLVEGDLRECDLGLPYNALWSAIINASLRRNAHLIRTADVNETASVVRLLVQKGCTTPPPPSGIAPPAVLTKRKRDAQPELVFMRQLMCIPSVSETVSRKLYEKFGALPALQEALRQKKFPKITLDEHRSIGKARREKLAAYLL